MFKDEKENPANFIRLLEWVACDAYLCYMTGLLVCRLWISGLMAKRRRTLYESKWLIMSVNIMFRMTGLLLFELPRPQSLAVLFFPLCSRSHHTPLALFARLQL